MEISIYFGILIVTFSHQVAPLCLLPPFYNTNVFFTLLTSERQIVKDNKNYVVVLVSSLNFRDREILLTVCSPFACYCNELFCLSRNSKQLINIFSPFKQFYYYSLAMCKQKSLNSHLERMCAKLSLCTLFLEAGRWHVGVSQGVEVTFNTIQKSY